MFHRYAITAPLSVLMTNGSSERVDVPPDTPQIKNHPLEVCMEIQDELPVAQENPLHLNGTEKNGGNQEIHYSDV